MKKLFALLLAGLMAVSLAACTNGGDQGESTSAPQSSSSTDSTEPSSEPTESSGDETTAQPTPIKKEINQTVTDPELGYTITLKQAIVDIPFDDPSIWYNGYRTGVCVEVELKNDSKYSSGGLYDSDLKLLVNGTPVATNSARINSFKTYADENNLVALTTNGIQPGESASGWLFYYFETGSGDNELALRYSRQETKIIVLGDYDGKETSTLPAKDFDISF